MVISFKDQTLEHNLERRSRNQNLSPSLLARKDISRFHWLLADHEPLELNSRELLAVASTVKATKWFDDPTLIKKFALLMEDGFRSSYMSETKQYTKEARFGINVDKLCEKLKTASLLQIVGLLDRVEQISEEEIKSAPEQWKEQKK